MKNVVLISDFLSSEILGAGGAQLYNEELVKILSDSCNITFFKSKEMNIEILASRKDSFFIVSNFMLLGEIEKKFIQENLKYCILEHDHKYCSTNNPALFKDFVIPENFIVNKNFYKKAYAVLCQSSYHSKILEKNLFLNNIVNLSCNLWSEREINILKKLINTKKEYKHSIFNTTNKNKGTEKARNFCLKNNLKFHEINHLSQEDFLEEIAKSENIIFFPTWIETFSRVAVEARILNCKLILNNFVGAMHEPFFSKKGLELLEYIISQREIIKKLYLKIIEQDLQKEDFFCSFEKPKVSIITTFYNSKKYIKNFMESIVKQTYFNNTEFIIIDAASSEDEYSIIKEYLTNNIKYIRLEEKKNIPECFNLAIKQATSDYIGFACVDDYMSEDHVEVLVKHLFNNPDTDLTYGDCLQTNKENETIMRNSSFGNLYEHSLADFSAENMVKCLPGPMPLFTKKMIEKNGFFEEKLKYANDWEFWLRCVNNGSKFKKVNFISGLYYNNPNGMSTSGKYSIDRRLEEKEVFNKYKNILGRNYERFKDYFNSI